MEPSSPHQDPPGWELPPDVAQVSHSRTDSKEPQMWLSDTGLSSIAPLYRWEN